MIRAGMSGKFVAPLFFGLLLAISCRAQERLLREAARLDSEQKCDEAETYYRKALTQGPPAPSLLNNYGNHFLACGQPDRARPWFERLLKLDPAHSNANLQIARLETEEKHGSKALAYLAHVKGDDPAIRLLRAEALHWAGQDAAAQSMLSSVDQDDPGIVFQFGLTCARIGLFDRAEAAFNSLLIRHPGDFDLLFNLGRAAARAGHADRAARALDAAMKIRPDDAGTLLELGLLCAVREDYSRAVYLLAQANRVAPDRPDILLALARASESAGYYGDAALAYDRYLQLRPQDNTVRRDRGLVYGLSESRLSEGLRELDQYIRKHPEDPAGHYDMARLCWRTDSRKSLEQLAAAIRADSGFAPARLARAWLLYRLGRASEALPDLQAADEAAPGNIRVLSQFGLVFLALERPTQAERVLRQALAIAPDDPDVLLNLGRSLIASGQEGEGRKLLERFQKLRPRSARGPLQEAGMIELATLPPRERTRRQIERLRKDAPSHPGDTELQLDLAALLLADGQTQEALQEFHALLDSNADAHIRRSAGTALLAAEQYDLARAFLEKAAADDPAARVDLAVAAFFFGGPASALEILESVPGCEQNGDCLLWKARLLDSTGHKAEAEQVLDRGLLLATTNPLVARQTALLLLRHQRNSDALTLLERSLSTSPGDADLLLARAVVLQLAGQTAAAEKAINELESRWPEWDLGYLAHGLFLERQARPVEARQKLQTALALGTPELPARCALARIASTPAPGPKCACVASLMEFLFPTCDTGSR
jgi:tetratricopeptide (TPR) repeat protein